MIGLHEGSFSFGVKQGVADEFRYRLDLEVVLMLSKRSPGPSLGGFMFADVRRFG